MRQNTIDLRALPQFSTYDNKGEKWGKLSFPSVRACHDASRTHARTSNESIWHGAGAEWLGLAKQSIPDFDKTGIATEPLRQLQDAQTKLPKQHTRLAQPHAAVTGGYWDTPSVLAGLPLSARTRKRAKLPPKDVKIAFFVSGGISAEAMAAITAKIAHAIWDYTLEGGAVNFSVAYCGQTHRSYSSHPTEEYSGFCVEFKVNCSDTATMALGLSPTMCRAVGYPLICALTEADRNGIPSPKGCPLPGYLWIGGVLRDALKAGDTVIQSLQITE